MNCCTLPQVYIMASHEDRRQKQTKQVGVAWPSPHEIRRLHSNAQPQKPTFKQRLCSKDSHKFRKYIENTTTHGVVRIFTGKSKARRLFWAIVVIFAAGFCLYNIVDQMILYAEDPTVTMVSQKENPGGIAFPAVTICNLNPFKKSVYESMVDMSALSAILSLYTNLRSETCFNETFIDILNQGNVSYRHIQKVARHQAVDLIVSCTFAGEECNHTDFSEVLTRLGYCYTFNSGRIADRPLLKSRGIGTRYGLSLILNVQQYEYLDWQLRLDAGVKVAVHSQEQPPVPDDIGIAIAPGRNMFIGIRQKNVTDTSDVGRRGRCRKEGTFNFFQDKFQYSSLSCLLDCFFTNITEECGCIDTSVEPPPPSSRYYGLPDCSVVDLYCCVLDNYNGAHVSYGLAV